MNEIELSVVVPVYNVELYLERCINSILNQTYQVGEIICVDDGSTDNSLEILKNFAQENSNIIIIHKENGGLVSARKAGLSVARGKYVAYVDSDDWIESNMYEEMMRDIIFYDADMATSGEIRDYGVGCSFFENEIEAGIYEGENLSKKIWECIIDTNFVGKENIRLTCWNKVYKKELLQKNQFDVDDRISVGEDAALVFPCILDAKRIIVTGKHYYHYCMRNDSICGKKRDGEWEQLQILYTALENKLAMYKSVVANIIEQFEVWKFYGVLLRFPEKVITFQNDTLYPYGEVKASDKIVLYGKGRFGKALYSFLDKEKYCEVVAWIDKNELLKENFQEYFSNLCFDKILIAVLRRDIVNEIYCELIKYIPTEKILTVDIGKINERK